MDKEDKKQFLVVTNRIEDDAIEHLNKNLRQEIIIRDLFNHRTSLIINMNETSIDYQERK